VVSQALSGNIIRVLFLLNEMPSLREFDGPRKAAQPTPSNGLPHVGDPGVMLIQRWLDLPPYVIQGLCNFPGLVSLSGEGARGQAAERHMGPDLIVISPPVFDSLPGVRHGEEPRGVQALRS
jgi:hypothetical protein